MQMRMLIVSASLAVGLAACGEEGAFGPGTEELVEASSGVTGGYTFGIGSGISSTDLKVAMVDAFEKYFLGGYPASYTQGTYSSRFTNYPEALWATSTQNSTVPWLRSAALFDNEQVWQTWTVDTNAISPNICNYGRPLWQVSMDYDVDSEPNYDFLVIYANNTCSSQVNKVKVSGKTSGSVSFYLPQFCPSPVSVTATYMKDVNTSVGLDMGRVKNVVFYPMCAG